MRAIQYIQYAVVQWCKFRPGEGVWFKKSALRLGLLGLARGIISLFIT